MAEPIDVKVLEKAMKSVPSRMQDLLNKVNALGTLGMTRTDLGELIALLRDALEAIEKERDALREVITALAQNGLDAPHFDFVSRIYADEGARKIADCLRAALAAREGR